MSKPSRDPVADNDVPGLFSSEACIAGMRALATRDDRYARRIALAWEEWDGNGADPFDAPAPAHR